MTRTLLTGRPTAVAAAGLCFMLLGTSGASAQGLTGSWTLSAETPRGAQTLTLLLEQDGAALTGSVTVTPPGGGVGPVETAIQDGSVTGASFTFVMLLERGGGSFAQTFSGTFGGDRMSGVISGGRGERPFTGERTP